MAADFGLELKGELHMDASAAKSLISRRGHGKAKHISSCDLWIQQRVQSNDFTVHKVRTEDSEADMGTNYLQWGKILHLCTLAGLVFQETTHKALQASYGGMHCQSLQACTLCSSEMVIRTARHLCSGGPVGSTKKMSMAPPLRSTCSWTTRTNRECTCSRAVQKSP